MGAFNIHEAARISGVRRVVSLSSEAVLGWSPGTWVNPHFPDYLPIDENHVCQPQDPYGLSKQVLECVGRTFTARYGLETLFIRATWIASPEEMEQLARSGGRRPVDFGLFHYIDVRDLAQACLRAVDCPLTGSQAIYVGAGETSISEPLSSLYQKLAPSVAESASMLTGHSAPVSIELAKKLLGWSPERSWRKFKL
jgi:nucleoside-diphosphate-sugar epimerase